MLCEKETRGLFSKAQKEHVYQRIFEIARPSSKAEPKIKRVLSRFYSEAQKKWTKVQRNHKRFLSLHKEWLNSEIEICTDVDIANEVSNPGKRGRPTKLFHESSEQTKRRKVKKLRQNIKQSELQFATQMNLRAAGKVDEAKVIKNITLSPRKPKTKIQNLKEIPAERTLAFMIQAGLSKNQYQLMKSLTKDFGYDIFPSYDKIKKEKKLCYPNILVSETKGEVKVQDILDHTAKRIIRIQDRVMCDLVDIGNELCLISKWGCDGSTGAVYKQKFQNFEDTDEYTFLTSFVPLRLITPNHQIIWQNPKPSSTSYCRPIRLQFKHENTENTVQETTYIENQIKDLLPTKINNLNINHEMIMSMIDGKVCNAVTDTKSTQRCYLCGLTSTSFNNLNLVIKTPVNKSATKFGLSSLHAWIRFFENFLHLAYKLNVKKWQVRDKRDKELVLINKKRIQREFKTKMGLTVDKAKQKFGSTNDGNTARRFFAEAEISADITGLDLYLLKRCRTILSTISSGFEINLEKFKEYALDTAKLYIAKYPWYNMSTTMHKILIHSPIIIESCILPIGMMSEEAQEARNKDIRKYREYYSRKNTRENNMEDVMKRLLISSDPYITSLQKAPHKRIDNFSRDVLDLLKEPTLDMSYVIK